MPAVSTDLDGNGRSIPVISRQVTRLHEMFWSVIDLINLGKELRQMSADERASFRASASKGKKQLLLLHDKLLELDPNLIERAMRAPREQINVVNRDLRKQLGEGQSNEWKGIAWNPPLGDKPTRGLFHLQCAELLSPVKYNWDDEKVREDFCNMDLRAGVSDWSRYLWLNNGRNYNPQRPSDGLLMNELLICALYAMLFSPTSAKSVVPATAQVSGARGCSFKRSKGTIGLAKAYNITKVTPAFIAYVAVVVCHALTSDETFYEICGGFNYGVYYNQIREFLEAPAFASRATILLKWWNERIFGAYNLGHDEPEEGEIGMLAALEAEIEGDEGLSGEEDHRPNREPQGGSDDDLEPDSE